MFRLLARAVGAASRAVGSALSAAGRLFGLGPDGQVNAATAPILGLRAAGAVAILIGGLLRFTPSPMSGAVSDMLISLGAVLWGYASRASDDNKEVIPA